jgi:PhzF family phenazine biosynthesis protein
MASKDSDATQDLSLIRSRPFQQVDVFTAKPYKGNPVAVVLDGTGLTTEQMQKFTDWTNLSEATFVLPPTHPEADYRLRIFCPGRELAFAGHPTLGSCHAWLRAGGKPRGEYVVQECGVGLVKLRIEGERISFAAPPLAKGGPLTEEELASVVETLKVDRSDVVSHAFCDNGPPWRGVMLKSAEAVLAVKPDTVSMLTKDMFVGIVGPAPDGSPYAFEVRTFCPGNNCIMEDPVTGSFNAAVAQWLIGGGLAPSTYVARQGTILGREGYVHVHEEEKGGDIWVGGECVTCIEGTVRI